MRSSVFLTAFLGLNSCSDLPYPPPATELCIIGYDKLICKDTRQDEYDYEKPITPTYICTNPDDYKSLQEYNLRLRQRIFDLERSCK
jgi:hypothetical protein